MADRALEREERLRAGELALAQRVVVPGEEPVPRRVVERELVDEEPAIAFAACANVMSSKRVPGYAASNMTAVLGEWRRAAS